VIDRSRPRICLFSERIARPFDEGFKNVALAIIRELSKRADLLALTAFGQDVPEYGIVNLRANRGLLSVELGGAIRDFSPELLCYIPTASYTLPSFLRARVLEWYARGARVDMIALQPRTLGLMARALVPLVRPDYVWVQSPGSRAELEALGCRVGILPSGVDTERFRPVRPAVKARLRAEHGISGEEFVVLHVGHINPNRNVETLGRVQELPGCQAVLAGSTSTPQDAELVSRLRDKGVRVYTGYLEHVEELYQMADCYFFPVASPTGCIEMPLSILEAMASDLPVVTTRYGGVPSAFSEAGGLLYGEDAEELLVQVKAARHLAGPGARHDVEPFTWGAILERTLLREGL